MMKSKEENRVKRCVMVSAAMGERKRGKDKEEHRRNVNFHLYVSYEASFVVERKKKLLICLFGFGWCCTVIQRNKKKKAH